MAAAPRATVKDFVDHIDYAVKLIGIDHIGISSDFDGGGGVDGWNSAAETFNVTLELIGGLYRRTDRQDLERQPSPRLVRRREGCQRDSGGAALSLERNGRPEGLHYYLDEDSPSMCTSSRWFTRMP
jgi:hypothetical protein